MGIAMEKTVIEDHFEVCLDALPGDLGAVEAEFIDALDIVDPHSFDLFHDDDLSGRELGEHRWYENIGVGREIPPEPGDVLCLLEKVDLSPDCSPEFLD